MAIQLKSFTGVVRMFGAEREVAYDGSSLKIGSIGQIAEAKAMLDTLERVPAVGDATQAKAAAPPSAPAAEQPRAPAPEPAAKPAKAAKSAPVPPVPRSPANSPLARRAASMDKDDDEAPPPPPPKRVAVPEPEPDEDEEDEEEEEEESGDGELPAAVTGASKLRDVIAYFVKAAGTSDAAKLTSVIANHAAQIPLVGRIANLGERVERTLSVMDLS